MKGVEFKTLATACHPNNQGIGFRTWMEKIEVSPHMPVSFWADALKRADDLESKFIPMDEIKRMERELDDDEYVEMRLSREFPYDIEKILKGDRKKLSEAIRDMKDSKDLAETRPDLYWGAYGVVARVDVFGDKRQREVAVQYNREYSEFFHKRKRHHHYGEVEKSLNELSPEDKEKVLSLKSVYKTVFEYIRLCLKVGRAARTAISSRDHRVKAFFSGQGDESKSIPQTGRVEVLYHATPYVREILKEGFKTKEDLGGKEALGGSTDGGISFTADLNVAREIAKCFKEVIGIAKGKIKLNDILRLIGSERTKGKVPWALEDYINKAKNRQWKWNNPMAKELSKQTGIPMPGKPYEINEKKDAFDLYKRYLSWSDKRYDPLFFGVNIEGFEMMDEANVGVVSAKVDMTKVMSYHQAMEEYRAPLNAILSVMAPRRAR